MGHSSNTIASISFDMTTGCMTGPAGSITLSPAMKALASCFWRYGEKTAFPFSVAQEVLWPEGAALPADPEQAFRHDLRELRIVTRALSFGGESVLDFRQDKQKNWLVTSRKTGGRP